MLTIYRVKKKRQYIKGGKGGKIKGFNFYLKNERLTKKQRKRLLKESENFVSPIDLELQIQDPTSPPHPFNHGFELDSSLSDEELMLEWNEMYDQYGYCFPQFRDQWERERIRGHKTFYKKNRCKDEDRSKTTEVDSSPMRRILESKRKSNHKRDDDYVDLG